ncbi:unnamed protein product [Brassica oleracea]
MLSTGFHLRAHGGRIVDEGSTNPTYKDFLPGRRYFTYNAATTSNLHNDGLHFRQPWVLGVQEEVRSLRQKVDEMAAEIAQLKELLTHNGGGGREAAGERSGGGAELRESRRKRNRLSLLF